MTDDTDKPEAPECGRLLRRTRERLGLSPEDVASELRLSQFQIQALEEDDWEQLPGTTYARGYLRSYARLLDLDADKLLEGATTQELNIPPAKPVPETAAPTDDDEAEPSPRGSIWPWVGAGAVVVLLAVYLWQFDQGAGVVTDMVGPSAGEQDEASDDTVSAAPAEAPETDGNDAGVSAAGDGQEGLGPLPEGWSRVAFRFDEGSWVDLRDARGERLLYRSFQPGRRIEVEGRPPFRVFLGNADGVEIEYSGETVIPDARSGRMYARFVLGAPPD